MIIGDCFHRTSELDKLEITTDTNTLIVRALRGFQESREWKGERAELTVHGCVQRKHAKAYLTTFQSTLNMYYLG